MELFEKVEKLRARANVTFEEAKDALERCDGDLLDAMVDLEKQGKVKAPEQSTYSTSYEEQEKYTSVKEKVTSQSKPEGIGQTIRKTIRGFIDHCRGNYLYVKRKDEVKIKLPVLAFLILGLAFWKIVLPVMILLLFFGFQYSFHGKDELKEANEIMEKVSDLADQVKENFTRDKDKEDH